MAYEYEYEYDDRTTGYDPHESYGRHQHDDFDDGGHAVSHSHSYGRPEPDYPPQPRSRHRSSQPVYEYAHGEYDYPTGVQLEPPTPDHFPRSPREQGTYDSDRITSDDGAYGAGGYGGHSTRGTSTPGGYGGGRTTVGDIWLADEKHGRVRDERPMLLGSIFCFFALAIVGIVCGIMLAVVFVRPPNVGIAGYTAPKIYIQNQTLMMNTTVYAGVSNPNSVGGKVKKLQATIYERDVPGHVLGTSQATDLKVNAHSNTTLLLPVQFEIASAQNLTSNTAAISKITQSCGWDLASLAQALGSTFKNDFLRRSVPVASDHSFAKRADSGRIPLLVDLDMKISVLSLNFNSPVKNVSIGVSCPSWSDVLGVSSGSSSSSSSSSSSLPTFASQLSTSRTRSSSSASTTSASPATPTTTTPSSSSSPTTTPVATSAPDTSAPPNTIQSFISSVTANNPGAASIVSQGEGLGQALSGVLSFISVGSLPIRRALPTDAPVA